MLFNSYVFIFAFLPLVLAGFALLRRSSDLLWPITWLVLASFVYYAWWRPEFLLLLLFSIAVNFGFGKLIIDGGRLLFSLIRSTMASAVAACTKRVGLYVPKLTLPSSNK